MKSRITFLLPEGTGIDPEDIQVGADHVNLTGVGRAVEERRVTVGLSELAQELYVVLKDAHELHIRWASPSSYDTVSPLVSGIPPGLHVFYTPRKAHRSVSLCPLLKNIFGPDLKCPSVEEAFSRPPILSERFSHAATYQYFHSLPSLRHLKAYVQNKICPRRAEDAVGYAACVAEAAALNVASSVDIDSDLITHALTLTAIWPPELNGGATGSARVVSRRRTQDSVELGLLQTEKPTELEELSLGGYLTVIGENDHPSATLFSFPSRHHPLPASDQTIYTSSFKSPTGLHPSMHLRFERSNLTPPSETCALHAYLTLPSGLFIDRYQLSDALFLRSQNLAALRALSGEQDLEAPDWVVQKWGSAALFELVVPSPTTSKKPAFEWTITIPTHLRYLPPSPNSTTPGYENLHVPWPTVFWACEAEEGLKMSTNPFDRVNLGYDGLFGPKTMFYHIPPATADGRLVHTLTVPVIDVQRAVWVQAGTALVVLAGFAWVCFKLLGVYNRTNTVTDTKKDR